MDEAVSLTSLSSQFVAADVVGTRGRKNVNKRREVDDDEFLLEPTEFEPFNFGSKPA